MKLLVNGNTNSSALDSTHTQEQQIEQKRIQAISRRITKGLQDESWTRELGKGMP